VQENSCKSPIVRLRAMVELKHQEMLRIFDTYRTRLQFCFSFASLTGAGTGKFLLGFGLAVSQSAASENFGDRLLDGDGHA